VAPLQFRRSNRPPQQQPTVTDQPEENGLADRSVREMNSSHLDVSRQLKISILMLQRRPLRTEESPLSEQSPLSASFR
jgi:hypothetical protein